MRARLAALGVVTLATATATVVRPQGVPAAGNVPIGGGVASTLELSLGALRAPSRAATGTARFSIDASVTSTEATAELSIADADAPTGRAHGHLVRAGLVLGEPLLVGARSATQPLDAPLDPLLRRWSDAVVRARTTIRMRQRLSGSASGFHKTVSITVASETP